jgi:hypothetical protein
MVLSVHIFTYSQFMITFPSQSAIYIYIYIYRVSQEFDAILQELTEGSLQNNVEIGTNVRKRKIAALGRHLKSFRLNLAP